MAGHLIPLNNYYEGQIPSVNSNKGFESTRSGGCKSNYNNNYVTNMDMNMNMSMMNVFGGGEGSGSGSISCQDCGNQAKKDCLHMRCRTCCKSRGFDCPTHVKSTWVPASVRRERHQRLTHHHPQLDEFHHEEAQTKRLRRGGRGGVAGGGGASGGSSSLVPTTITTTTSSFSGTEVGNFPAEVSSTAVFRCVRVSSMDETEDEFAYQTAVNIGGHVFKGILYDQGPDPDHDPTHQVTPQPRTTTAAPPYAAAQPSSAAPYHDAGGGLSAVAGGVSTGQTMGGYFDPALYPVPLSSWPPGTQFFPNPRP